MDSLKLFISHTSRIKKTVAELKEHLNNYGITCFVAHTDIQISDEWQEEIENAIRDTDGFVALLTKDFSESEWTDQEVGIALGYE